MSKLPPLTEHQEQAAFYQWCLLNSCRFPGSELIYAIPNGFHAPQSSRRWMLEEGMRPGFPDLGLPVPRGNFHGAFIEMKRTGGDNPRPDQIEWLKSLGKQGYAVYCCKGYSAARRVLQEYMGN